MAALHPSPRFPQRRPIQSQSSFFTEFTVVPSVFRALRNVLPCSSVSLAGDRILQAQLALSTHGVLGDEEYLVA
jgi:hypothetical protein